MCFFWVIAGDLVAVSILAKANESASGWIWIVVAAVLGGAWYGLTKWNRIRKGDSKSDASSPKSLVAELSAAHKLSRIERSLLTEAAATQNLQDPTLLFVDARILKCLSTGPKGAEFSALAQKLFG